MLFAELFTISILVRSVIVAFGIITGTFFLTISVGLCIQRFYKSMREKPFIQHVLHSLRHNPAWSVSQCYTGDLCARAKFGPYMASITDDRLLCHRNDRLELVIDFTWWESVRVRRLLRAEYKQSTDQRRSRAVGVLCGNTLN